MQVNYNRLKNPSKNLWCNRQAIYQSLYSSRYVDHQTGPFGCLFPYPNFFGYQEISPICLEQQGLPISE
jgi:hypothetical protein